METQFHIGCSGFYNKHWKDVFFPENLPQNKWFNYYCEQFSTIELNSTFYKFPTVQSLQTWFKKSPDEFLFSVKAPKLITHVKKFNDCELLINDFYLACDRGLSNKLGCILFQFPPSVHFSEQKLQQIIVSLNHTFKNVVEFRHESWWCKKVYDELTKNGISFCSVNHPKLPDNIIANTSTAYIRLHGNPQIFYSNYSTAELDQLCQTILKKRKLKEVYVYFNNTASTAGVLNAMQLKQIV